MPIWLLSNMLFIHTLVVESLRWSDKIQTRDFRTFIPLIVKFADLLQNSNCKWNRWRIFWPMVGGFASIYDAGLSLGWSDRIETHGLPLNFNPVIVKFADLPHTVNCEWKDQPMTRSPCAGRYLSPFIPILPLLPSIRALFLADRRPRRWFPTNVTQDIEFNPFDEDISAGPTEKMAWASEVATRAPFHDTLIRRLRQRSTFPVQWRAGRNHWSIHSFFVMNAERDDWLFVDGNGYGNIRWNMECKGGCMDQRWDGKNKMRGPSILIFRGPRFWFTSRHQVTSSVHLTGTRLGLIHPWRYLTSPLTIVSWFLFTDPKSGISSPLPMTQNPLLPLHAPHILTIFRYRTRGSSYP